MKGTLLSFFEPEEIEEWTDPYNSIYLKLLTIITYLIEIWASTIMVIFVSYETRGLFGHYRTVINQLLSYAYAAVSIKKSINDACLGSCKKRAYIDLIED
jgi:hypothetical protein